jgi:oligo-1,6-glucosidase
MVSKFGNETPEFRELSSKMLTTFIFTMRGTPFYYMGDEIGMTNIRFDSITDYNDVDTRNKYTNLKNKAGDTLAFLEEQKQVSRENGRTPMQWDNDINSGFTTGTPWLKTNPNYNEINVKKQEQDPTSILNYFRKTVQLRKNNPVLVYGKYSLLDKENPDVFAYLRDLNGKRVLVLLNFTNKNTSYNLNLKLGKNEVLLNNYNDITDVKNNKLRPYESLVVAIE